MDIFVEDGEVHIRISLLFAEAIMFALEQSNASSKSLKRLAAALRRITQDEYKSTEV